MLEVDGLSKRPSFKACYHFLRGVYQCGVRLVHLSFVWGQWRPALHWNKFPLPMAKNKKRKRQEKICFFFQSFLFGEPSQILIGPRWGLSKRPSSYCLISLLKRCVSVLYTNCFLKVKEDLLGCCIKGEGGFVLIRIWSAKKVYSILYSQAVTHPSTNRTQPCLTSVIGRELVYSRWYGRRHLGKL